MGRGMTPSFGGGAGVALIGAGGTKVLGGKLGGGRGEGTGFLTGSAPFGGGTTIGVAAFTTTCAPFGGGILIGVATLKPVVVVFVCFVG